MKKSFLLVASLLTIVAMTSCGGPESGPAEKVLKKKVYTQVVNKYEYVGGFVDGVCIVRAGWNQYGVINTKGEEIIPADVYQLGDVVDGMIIAKNKESKCGAYNTKGELVVPYNYIDIEEFCSGLARVGTGSLGDSKYGYVDKTGKEVITPKYDKAAPSFSEELAYVGTEDGWGYKYGYINVKGEEVIPMTYADANNFHEGMAAVKTKNGYGYINTKGELQTAAKYDDAAPFSDELAIVEKDGKLLVINKKGEELFTFARNRVPTEMYHDGLLLVYDTKLMKFGFYDKKGEVALPFEYSAADGFNDGKALTAWAEDGECVFKFIDKKGEVVGIIDEDTYTYEYDDLEDVFYICVEKILVEAKLQSLLKNIPADLTEAVSSLEFDKLITLYVQAVLAENDDLLDNLENQLENIIYKADDRYGEDVAEGLEDYIDEILNILE